MYKGDIYQRAGQGNGVKSHFPGQPVDASPPLRPKVGRGNSASLAAELFLDDLEGLVGHVQGLLDVLFRMSSA